MPNPLARDNIMTLVLAPTLWALHFLLVYVFNAIACAKLFAGDRWLGLPAVPLGIMLITVPVLAAIGWLALVAWRRYVPVRGARHLVHVKDIDRSIPARQRFLAYAALLLSGLSGLAVVMQAMPALWVPPCG